MNMCQIRELSNSCRCNICVMHHLFSVVKTLRTYMDLVALQKEEAVVNESAREVGASTEVVSMHLLVMGINFEENPLVIDEGQVSTSSHGRYFCDECNKDLSFKTQANHVNMHRLPFECFICGLAFARKGRRDRHVAHYHPKWESEIIASTEFVSCNRLANKKKQRLRDNKDKRAVVPRYYCRFCKKDGGTFIGLAALQAHYAEVHSIVLKHCSLCDQTFHTAFGLKNHEVRMHCNSKRYDCRCCVKPQSFASASLLSWHENQNLLPATPFKCQFCDDSFRCRAYLKRHSRLHCMTPPFLCDICGSLFHCARALMNHWSNRTNGYPFQCSQCERTFCYLMTRKQHELRDHRGLSEREILQTIHRDASHAVQHFRKRLKQLKSKAIKEVEMKAESIT